MCGYIHDMAYVGRSEGNMTWLCLEVRGQLAEIELKSSGLVARAFPCWAIFLAPKWFLVKKQTVVVRAVSL